MTWGAGPEVRLSPRAAAASSASLAPSSSHTPGTAAGVMPSSNGTETRQSALRLPGLSQVEQASADRICVRDSAQLPPLPALPVRWTPDLTRAATADSWQQLRYLLSGRVGEPVSEDLQALLREYSKLHADIVAGRRPLRVLVMEGCGYVDGRCGGLGDRLKSLRMCFYVALLSERALLLQDWYPVSVTAVLTVGEIDWRLPSHVAGLMNDAPFVHGKWCVIMVYKLQYARCCTGTVCARD